MKKLIVGIAVISLFAACKSKTETNRDVVGIDSTGLYKNNTMADTANLNAVAPGTTTKRVVETRNPDGTTTTTTTTVTAKGDPNTSTANTGTVAQTTSSSTGTTTTVTKKGWSNKAKGAVIGGVGGAVVGAAVSKKKGKGALIGGVVGAAGGYIIGNEKDKKQGR